MKLKAPKHKDELLGKSLLKLFATMGQVVLENSFNAICLCKDNILFGIISDGKLFLRTKKFSGKYFSYRGVRLAYVEFANVVDIISKSNNIAEIDNLLKAATESYWLAKSETENN